MTRLMSALKAPLALTRKKVRRDQAVDLFDQLENLLTAGLPLDRALHVLGGTAETEVLRALIFRILLDIEKGRTFAEALAEHPQLFRNLEISMVRAGEEGGVLPLVLRRLSTFHVEQREFRRFLVASSIYPVTLLVFGLLALTGILVFVLPKFAEAYADMADQGGAAAFLIGLSDLVRGYGLYVVALLVAAAVGLRMWIATPRGLQIAQAFLLKLPLLGGVLLKSELSRVLQTLGILLGTGVPIVSALRLSRGLARFGKLNQALHAAEQQLRDGRGLAKPLLANPLFPPLVGQMALVGEESGALDKMLYKVGQRLESEVRAKTQALMAILEPLLIIGIGLLIGAIVVTMISAILSMNELPG